MTNGDESDDIPAPPVLPQEEQDDLDDILGPPVAPQEELEDQRGLTDAERDIVDRWNNERPEGVGTISATEARRARIYSDVFGISFWDALTVFSRWQQGDPNVPAPSHPDLQAARLGMAPLPSSVRRAMQRILHRVGIGPGAAQPVTEPQRLMGYTVSPEVYNAVNEYATAHGIPFNLLMGIVLAESGGDPTASGDGGHSVGLLQLLDEITMPDGTTARGQGYGMTVEERQDIRRNLDVGVPPIAAAYREAVAMGLTGDELVEYVAAQSGHPGPAEAGAAGRARIGRMVSGLGGAGGVPIAESVRRGPRFDVEEERISVEEERVRVTDTDRILNEYMGLGLSDAEIRMAKLLGIPMDRYARVLAIADVLGVPTGTVLQRLGRGEDIDEIENQAQQVGMLAVINATVPGATEEERVANFVTAYEQGLTLEETRLALMADPPISLQNAARVKRLLAELTGRVDPANLPTFGEALVASEDFFLTPEELAMTNLLADVTPANFRYVQALGQEALARGELTQEEAEAGGGRGLLLFGRQELARLEARAAAETPVELFDVLRREGLTAREIESQLRARWGPGVIPQAESGRYRLAGRGPYGVFGFPVGAGQREPLIDRLLEQRFREAFIRREAETGIRMREMPGQRPREGPGEEPISLIEREPELTERLRERGEIGETDTQRLERGLRAARRRRTPRRAPRILEGGLLFGGGPRIAPTLP